MAGTGATALVTGGGGFIGSHLVNRLLREGQAVRVLDNFATGRRANLEDVLDDIELIEGDLQSYERVHNAVRGCDFVFHLGALPSVPRSIQDPLTSNATNVVGTLNVLLASRDEGVSRVVYASSSSVYGASAELPKREDMHPRPIAPYAVSKLAAEGYCRAFHEVYGLETVALRYFNVFGPGQDPQSQYAAVIPNFITAVLEGRAPIVHGDGEQSRDFTFIDNAVDANLRAASAGGAAGQMFNIACGERTSLNEIVARLAVLAGKEVEAVNTDPRPGDVRHSLADISKAQQILGYEPVIDFGEGLQKTYMEYQELWQGEALGSVS
ncbi:MAG TPA: SDR family oxidoreductase [Solirubrobacterales bacterium]|nr:SDR family oxidoreductase [Solirubrobacterales bacterium]